MLNDLNLCVMKTIEMDRQDVITEIVDDYIETIKQNYIQYDDFELLNSILRGDGFTPISELSDEQLETEYLELFDERIKIID